MESESQSSVDSNNEKSKLEHIKQRLKEMGVSDDSERPAKSWLSKYGKFLMIIIAAALVVAYGVEYSKQGATLEVTAVEDTAVEDTSATNPAQQAYNGYATSQHNQMAQSNYHPAPWMQPPWLTNNTTGDPSTADNASDTTSDSEVNQQIAQQNNNPYYAPRYPMYPRPYWNNNPRPYPVAPAPAQRPVPVYGNQQGNGGYAPMYPGYYGPTPPFYSTPYGRPPYYYGGQRY